ncbi:MAG: divalent metal cation transporter [Pirellulaceae bacterium]
MNKNAVNSAGRLAIVPIGAFRSQGNHENAAIPSPSNRWYHRIGPGLITACVVIGPGSITTSSCRARSTDSAELMIVLAVALMMAFMITAKLGAVANDTAGTLNAQKRAGRWLSALIGISVFFIAAAFQFGNNLGVYAAFQESEKPLSQVPYLKITHLVVAFNALSIAFLFLFHNLAVMPPSVSMMAFVAVMLISFAINLVFSRPAPGEFLMGFVPPVGKLFGGGESTGIDLSLLGLTGTTFVITAAYYQSYLVRQKGWGLREMANGLLDASAV